MNMSLQISIIDIDQIDMDQFIKLQKLAFRDILITNKVSDDYITSEFFLWKYTPPAGKAKIAVVYQEGKMVGSVSIVPIDIFHEGRMKKIWNVGDVAVLPEYRGKFLYNRCITALKNDNPNDELLFGFPNHNNLPGTKRAGFRLVKDLAFYFKPFFLGFPLRRIMQMQLFPYSQDQYALTLAEKAGVTFYRSEAYMNWRYIQKPATSYHCYAYKENDVVFGNAVTRTIKRNAFHVLLVMEYHFSHKKAIPFLNRFINQMAIMNRCVAVIMLSASNQFTNQMGGFYLIPARFQPKKMVLYANPLKEEDEALLTDNWFIQTGDWDAF